MIFCKDVPFFLSFYFGRILTYLSKFFKNVTIKNMQEEKKQEDNFVGTAIDHPVIHEVPNDIVKEEKSDPVIIEWKKPFFITFALGVAAVALMYILKK